MQIFETKDFRRGLLITSTHLRRKNWDHTSNRCQSPVQRN